MIRVRCQPEIQKGPMKPTLIAVGLAEAILIGSLSGMTFAAEPRKPNAKPNIVFILADDVGYGDLGCYGAVKVKTPNIDRLASEGRRFTDAHSASAVCTPSRYALLTGEYPFRKNLWGPVMNDSPLLISTSTVTVAGLLKQQGYATACFGKWHLGFGSAPRPDWNTELKPGPLELGFDHYYGIPVVSSHPPFVWVEDRRVVGLDPADPLVYGGTPPTQSYPEKMLAPGMSGAKAAHDLYRDDQLGTSLTEKAVTWIRSHQDEPFFLFFSTPHVHHPFTPAKRFVGTSSCGPYGDFLHEFDWMVGELLRTLDETGLRDNTLVVVTSDNGGMLNGTGQQAWQAGHRLNGNLLGFKFDAWEGGHRVPFIARWPGHVAAGSTSDQLICHVDMLATFAAITGQALPDDAGADSFNVLPTLVDNSAKPVRDHVVLAPLEATHLALRDGPWVYIGARGGGGFNATQPGEHRLGGPSALRFTGEVNSDVVDGKIKPDAPQEQLYDLANDPAQTKNLAAARPEIVKEMRDELAAIRSKPRSRP